MPRACVVRNCFQVGPVRRGAGSIPAACRICHTVEAAIGWPILTSSPCTRRCPQVGFCRHADHELADRGCGGRSLRMPSAGVVPFAVDQPPVPGEQRCRGHREHPAPSAPRDQPGQHHQTAEQTTHGKVDDGEDHSAMIPPGKAAQTRSSNRARHPPSCPETAEGKPICPSQPQRRRSRTRAPFRESPVIAPRPRTRQGGGATRAA